MVCTDALERVLRTENGRLESQNDYLEEFEH